MLLARSATYALSSIVGRAVSRHSLVKWGNVVPCTSLCFSSTVQDPVQLMQFPVVCLSVHQPVWWSLNNSCCRIFSEAIYHKNFIMVLVCWPYGVVCMCTCDFNNDRFTVIHIDCTEWPAFLSPQTGVPPISGRIKKAVFSYLSLPFPGKTASLEWNPCNIIEHIMTWHQDELKLSQFSNQKTFSSSCLRKNEFLWR